MKGTDWAIWRRIRLIPFTVTIEEHERDPNLSAKLKEELPGILAWAVRGCLAWQQEGLGTCEEVSTATANYRADSDLLGDFLAECCVLEKDVSAAAKDLYAAYLAWAEETGEREPLTQKFFGILLGERGLERKKGAKGRRIWSGIGIRALADQNNKIGGGWLEVADSTVPPEISNPYKEKPESRPPSATRHLVTCRRCVHFVLDPPHAREGVCGGTPWNGRGSQSSDEIHECPGFQAEAQ